MGFVIKVIPFSTPTDALEYNRLSNESISEVPSGISGQFLLYPAQFWPHKNHLRLLQAAKLLHERHGWDGTVVCCGSDKGNIGYLQQRAKALGIQHKVHFLGFVKRSELLALYRGAFALCFPSYFGPDNLPP